MLYYGHYVVECGKWTLQAERLPEISPGALGKMPHLEMEVGHFVTFFTKPGHDYTKEFILDKTIQPNYNVGMDNYYKGEPRHAYYLERVLTPKLLAKVVRNSLMHLREMRADAIVVTGISGLLLGGAISVKSGIPCIVVRKTLSDCHSSCKVELPEGVNSKSRIVFVDDCISSGATLTRVINALKRKDLSISNTVLNYHVHEKTAMIGNKKYKVINLMQDKD